MIGVDGVVFTLLTVILGHDQIDNVNNNESNVRVSCYDDCILVNATCWKILTLIILLVNSRPLSEK